MGKWVTRMLDIFQRGLKNYSGYKPLWFRALSLAKCSEEGFKIIYNVSPKEFLTHSSERAGAGMLKEDTLQSHELGWVFISIWDYRDSCELGQVYSRWKGRKNSLYPFKKSDGLQHQGMPSCQRQMPCTDVENLHKCISGWEKKVHLLCHRRSKRLN